MKDLKRWLLRLAVSVFVGGVVYVWLGGVKFEQWRLLGLVSKSVQANQGVEIVTDDSTKNPPTKIYFPKLDKTLIVSASVIQNGEWQLFDDKVAWLSTSAIPGEGNSIVYAHNFAELFGDIYRLEVGDVIWVEVGSQWLRFRVSESKQISPSEVEQVTSDENRLTLYTCEGRFDSKRRLVYAEPSW